MTKLSYEITNLTPIMSGLFLFTALYLIRKSVGNNSQLNIKAMTFHAASFGLYMASVLLYVYVFIIANKISTKTFTIFSGITKICEYLSQAVLCLIFWDLGKKKAPKQAQKKQEIAEKVVSDLDDQIKEEEHVKTPEIHQNPSTVVNYDSDESEEEPETIYNSAEARRLF